MYLLTLLPGLLLLPTFSAFPVHSTHQISHPTGQNAVVPGKWFDNIITILLENADYSSVMRDSSFKQITSTGVLLSNYNAITHPSQPNYVAMIYGDESMVSGDDNVNIKGTNLIDLLESKGIEWKTYQENYNGKCDTRATNNGLYARKHNPFISMTNIQTNPNRCAKIVNANDFATDLQKGTIPQYSFYTPNLDNDGHDTSISTAGKFLAPFLKKITSSSFYTSGRTLIVVTFDEDDELFGRNQVWTVLLGSPGVLKNSGASDNGSYNHYSLLKTVEDNWSLGDLGRNDKNAKAFGVFQ